MPKTKSINLLPQEAFETSIIGRVLRWAMGTFRIIVIVTEIVVMAAFLSRFWLDAKNSDLTGAIKVKVSQIESQSALENQFRALQTKLTVAKEINQVSPPSKKFEVVTSSLPFGVTLTEISATSSTVQVKGISGSEMAIGQFASNLKAEKSFKQVEIGQISSSESDPSLIIFSISITY
jgi:Tfp pilus assembly protein PilN